MGTTFLYSRVSTAKQSKEGVSLEQQASWAENLCRERGWLPLDTLKYREEGEHGDQLDRPRLKALLLDAARGRVQRVVVYESDRLARDLDDFRLILEWLNKFGVHVYMGDVPQAGEDTGLLITIKGAINENFLVHLRKKTRDALHHLQAQGVKLGRPTVGVERVGEKVQPLPWIPDLRAAFEKKVPSQSSQDIERLKEIASTKRFGWMNEDGEFHPYTAWGLRTALVNAAAAEDGKLLSMQAKRETQTRLRRERYKAKKQRQRDIFELELRKALLGVD